MVNGIVIMYPCCPPFTSHPPAPGFRLTSGKAVLEMEKWRKLQHTNLVALREMFTTKAFGDNCRLAGLGQIAHTHPRNMSPAALVFVYDYHSGAESMQSRHLQHGRRAGGLIWKINGGTERYLLVIPRYHLSTMYRTGTSTRRPTLGVCDSVGVSP